MCFAVGSPGHIRRRGMSGDVGGALAAFATGHRGAGYVQDR